MNAPARLTTFAIAMAAVLGGGVAAGAAFGPDRGDDPEPAAAASAHGHDASTQEHSETVPATVTETTGAAHGAHGAEPAAGDPVRGLAVAEDGLRVVVDDPALRRGRPQTLRFRIVDDRGETVRDFDVTHTKRMHLILARRDLTGFQHLHPVQRADGTWTTRTTLDEPGSYRLFADFSRGDRAHTLATDLRVDGAADLRALPEPQPTAVSDGGYDVRLDAAHARPGRESELRFSVTRDGVPVHTEPYLGAGGHLVALREGDLAFLHVHPTEAGADRGAAHDDSIGFAATFPTAGRYRLFLQFQHEGRVQTVAFTQEVE